MGKLRKIGRKIDRGIRKVFGKDGWLKAAATVAAIYFAAPVFGSGAMSFKPAATGSSSIIPEVARDKLIGKEAVLEETRSSMLAAKSKVRAPRIKDSFKSMTDTSKEFFFGDPEDDEDAGLFGKASDFTGSLVKDAFKVGVYGQLVGDDEFIGSTKGVQQIAADEPSLIGELQNFMSSNPQAMPTNAVPTVQPVFATANIG